MTKRLNAVLMIAAMLGVGLAALATQVVAIDTSAVDHCAEQSDGNAKVVTPGGALVVNFTPECVSIKNGGTVTFQGIDADPHRPIIPAVGTSGKDVGCYDTGTILTGEGRSVTLTVTSTNPADFADPTLAGTDLSPVQAVTTTYTGGSPLTAAAVPGVASDPVGCDTTATNQLALPGTLEATNSGPDALVFVPVLDSTQTSVNEVVVHFTCAIHGPVMHGEIHILL
jgi:plastocyanin